LQLVDAGRHLAYRYVAHTHDFARFDHQVGLRHRAAEQGLAGALLIGRQRAFLVRAVDDFAVQDLALAGAAGPVLAAVRQADAGANGCCQYAFVVFTGKLPTARLNSYLERHTIPKMKNNVMKATPGAFGKPR